MSEVRPEQFFSDTPPQQIIGSETEYDVQIPDRYEDEDESLSLFLQHETLNQIGLQGSKHVDDLADHGLIDATWFNPMISDLFLSNGSRLYVDVNHLEYCTPESLGPKQAAATDAAGPIILTRLLGNSPLEDTKIYRRTGMAGSPQRNSGNQTRGHHENFLVPAKLSHTIARELPTFVGTRSWTWTGIVRANFEQAQKVSGIGFASSITSTGSTSEGKKPMLNIRAADQEPDINLDTEWSRLEIRFADTTHMPHAKYLSYAATSLMLRLCAHNGMVPELSRYRIYDSDVVDAAKQTSRDLNMRTLITTMNREQVSALDIQEHYVEMFEKIDGLIDLPHDERIAIPALRKLVDDMRLVQSGAEDITLIADRVEWAARYHYLSRKLGGSAITIENPDAEALDLLWDRCGDGYGPRYAELLRRKAAIAKIGPDHEMIDEHVYNPPMLTRAGLRAQLIEESGVLFESLSWSRAKYHALGGGVDGLIKRHSLSEVSWPNPYEFL